MPRKKKKKIPLNRETLPKHLQERMDRGYELTYGKPIQEEEPLLSEEALEQAAVEETSTAPVEPFLSDESLIEADKEIEDIKNNQKGRAWAEAAARSVTLGLSDVAAVAAGADPQEMLDRQEYVPGTTTIDVGGTIAAGLLSGGAHTAAKIGVGTGVKLGLKGMAKAAAKKATTGAFVATEVAGRTAEAFTKTALRKVLKETGRKTIIGKLMKETAGKAARFGTEGAIFAGGRFASDVALEKVDLTAENFISHVGVGALLSGGIGSFIGAGKVMMPGLKKLGGGVSTRLVERYDNMVSPEVALQNYMGVSANYISKKGPNFWKKATTWVKPLFADSTKATPKTVAAAAQKKWDLANDTIKAVASQIDERTKDVPNLFGGRFDLVKKLEANINAFTEKGTLNKQKLSDEALKAVDEAKEAIYALVRNARISSTTGKPANVTFTEVNQLRSHVGKILGGAIKSNKSEAVEDLFGSIYGALRGELDTAAKAAQANIGQEGHGLANLLKQATSDSHMGFSIVQELEKVAVKEAQNVGKGYRLTEIAGMSALFHFFGPLAPVAAYVANSGITTSMTRNLAIRGDLFKHSQAVTKKLNDIIPAFLSGSKTALTGAGKASLKAAQYSLSQSGLSVIKDPKTGKIKKAENDKEAFQNIQTNLEEYTANPDKLHTQIIKATGVLNNHIPEVGVHVGDTLQRGVSFLAQKIPKSHSTAAYGPWARKYEPSSMEISKFSRYVQIVENPTSVLDEMANDTMTQEHAEALKNVFPSILRKIQEKVLEEIKTDKNELSYSRKILISNLLNIKADPSMSGEFIMNMQATISPESYNMMQQQLGADAPAAQAAAQAQGAPQGPDYNPQGAAKSEISQRAETDTQSSINRRRN